MPLFSAQTKYEHILLNEAGIPTIAGTDIKVLELVLERTAYGWSPEELHYQHPFLSLGQIYSASAYYYDHQEEIDEDIEQRLQRVDQIREEKGPSPLLPASGPKVFSDAPKVVYGPPCSPGHNNRPPNAESRRCHRP
jgi:uncharacterized protein (DUF433 family)